MPRLKRAQFWGRDADDDHLLQQVLAGTKTATADLADTGTSPMASTTTADTFLAKSLKFTTCADGCVVTSALSKFTKQNSAVYLSGCGGVRPAPAQRIFGVGTGRVGQTGF